MLFLGAALALTGSSWGSPEDFGKQFLAQIVLLAVIVFGVTRLVRFNILGYFLIAASVTLLAASEKLLEQPDAFYRVNGYAVLLMLMGLLAWPLVAWRTRTAAAHDQ